MWTVPVWGRPSCSPSGTLYAPLMVQVGPPSPASSASRVPRNRTRNWRPSVRVIVSSPLASPPTASATYTSPASVPVSGSDVPCVEMGPLTWKSGRAPLTSNAPPSIVASTALPASAGGAVVGGVVVVLGCSSASSAPMTSGWANGWTADAGPSVVVVESAGMVDDETSFDVVPTCDDGADAVTWSGDLVLSPSSAGPAIAAG